MATPARVEDVKTKGAILIVSKLMQGQRVVILKDRAQKVKPLWTQYPTFTLEEVGLIQRHKLSPQRVRDVLVAKLVFPGCQVVSC